MNNEALKFLKDEYYKGIENRNDAEDHFSSLLKKRDKMEKNPIVVKYLKLLKEIDNSTDYFIRDEDIMFKAYDALKNNGMITDTNEIYFYYGTYIETNEETIQVPRNSDIGVYDIYRDIESRDCIKNPVELRSIFESNHKVIVFPRPFPSAIDFNDLHRDFLNTAIKEGQDVACKKVLSRNF